MNATIEEDCVQLGQSLKFIATYNESIQEPWPNVNQTAYKAISQCVTMIPMCDPKNLMGHDDIRSTYPKAAATGLLTQYWQMLQLEPLMWKLNKIYVKNGRAFMTTLEQIKSEIIQLQKLQSYFGYMSKAMTEFSNHFQSALMKNEAMLLAKDSKITTTTTTTGAPLWKTILSVADTAMDLITAVGAGIGFGPEEISGFGDALCGATLLGTQAQALPDYKKEEPAEKLE